MRGCDRPRFGPNYGTTSRGSEPNVRVVTGGLLLDQAFAHTDGYHCWGTTCQKEEMDSCKRRWFVTDGTTCSGGTRSLHVGPSTSPSSFVLSRLDDRTRPASPGPSPGRCSTPGPRCLLRNTRLLTPAHHGPILCPVRQRLRRRALAMIVAKHTSPHLLSTRDGF